VISHNSNIDDHGVRRADTAQAVVQWWHVLAAYRYPPSVSSRLTNSAHGTGVMSECEKGNCKKELEVQFLSRCYVQH